MPLGSLGQESPCSSWFQLAKILSAALDRSRRQRMRSSHLHLPDLTSAEKHCQHIKKRQTFSSLWSGLDLSIGLVGKCGKHVSKTCFKTCEPCSKISKCLTSWHPIRNCLRHCWSASSHQDTCWRQRSCQGSTAPMEDGLSLWNTWQCVGQRVGQYVGIQRLGSWWLLMALAHLSPVCSSSQSDIASLGTRTNTSPSAATGWKFLNERSKTVSAGCQQGPGATSLLNLHVQCLLLLMSWFSMPWPDGQDLLTHSNTKF